MGGTIFVLNVVLSSVVRLVCERFRGDERGAGTGSTTFFATCQLVGGLGVASTMILSSVHGLSWSVSVGDFSLRSFILGNSASLGTTFEIALENGRELVSTFAAAFLAYGTQLKHQQVPAVKRKETR